MQKPPVDAWSVEILRHLQSSDARRHAAARQRLREADEAHAVDTLARLIETTAVQSTVRMVREIAFGIAVLLIPLGFYLAPFMGPVGVTLLVLAASALLIGPALWEALAGRNRLTLPIVDAFLAEAERVRTSEAVSPLLRVLGNLETRRDIDAETGDRLRGTIGAALLRLLPAVTDDEARALDHDAQEALRRIVGDASPVELAVAALLVLSSRRDGAALDEAVRIARDHGDERLRAAAEEYLRSQGKSA